MRIDCFLHFVRLVKSRTLAQAIIDQGHVRVLVHGKLDRLVGVTRAADQHHLVVVRKEVGEGDAQGGFVVSDEDTDRVGAHAAGTTRRVGGSSDGHRGDATRQQPPAQAHEPFLPRLISNGLPGARRVASAGRGRGS